MKNRLELVRYDPVTVLPSEAGLERREEAEVGQILDFVLEQAEGDTDAARKVLDLTLMFLNHGPVWGRSLFLSAKHDNYSLAEVFTVMDLVILTEEAETRADVVRVAYEGMLRQPYFGQLYMAMVENLGGEAAMVQLKAKLRTTSGGLELTEGGRELYRQTAGRSAWVWDEGTLLKIRDDLVRYQNGLLRGLKSGRSFPMMAVMAVEVDGQIAALDKVVAGRGIKV